MAILQFLQYKNYKSPAGYINAFSNIYIYGLLNFNSIIGKYKLMHFCWDLIHRNITQIGALKRSSLQ